MNPTANALAQIADIVNKSSAGVIALPANPHIDTVAAGISLYLALSKTGKNITLACATAPQSELIGSDKITQSISVAGDNMVIGIPYTDGAIDKVDYGGIQGNYLNIIVIPRPGAAKIDPKKVRYSYQGGIVDFLIALDAPNLNSLGELYTDNQKEFEGKTIINIDRHLVNTFYGTVNLVNKTSSSISEIILRVLQALHIDIDKEMATNLYSGLAAATNNFTAYSVNADTFEAAANLLKAGAMKKVPGRQQNQPNQPVQPMRQSQPRPAQSNSPANSFQPRRQAPPPPPPPPMPQAMDDEEDALEPMELESEDETDDQNEQQAAPQDWLKPKIYRGGGGLI